MSIKLQLPDVTEMKPRITVIGIGGAGGNAVNNMIASGLDGVEFVVANTDAQALAMSSAEHVIQLGVHVTEGLGAGARPEVGSAAAEEALDELRAQVSGSHMVFIAAGMGGGTGTGAASVIAQMVRELGILTVAVVTKPFHFEGNRRMRTAEAGIEELGKHVDTLIVIPNQNLFRIANEKTTFAEAFVLADQVLHSGISCITDLIVREGLINLDFADVRAIMLNMGTAMMGTGEASGERRAVEAAEIAISNPLLDEISLRGAKGLLISISGSHDMTLYEVDEAASRIREEVDPDANIIVGATFDEQAGDKLRVSIVASGLDDVQQHEAPPVRRARVDASAGQEAGAPEHGRPQSFGAVEHGEPGRADVAERLSQAMRTDAGGTDAAGTTDDDDDVTIELGPPSILPTARSAEEQAGDGEQQQKRGFEPAAPAQVRRHPPRMPGVDDFPAVGQKDYHAKKEQGGSAAGEPEVRRRRSSLFERLTGRAGESDAEPSASFASESDSQDPPKAPTDERQNDPGRAASADASRPRTPPDGRREAPTGTDGPDGDHSNHNEREPTEMPRFFRRQGSGDR